MAYVLPESDVISPFKVLLGAISNQLSRENVRKMKVQLRGHVSKEILGKLKDGRDLVKALQERGLVTEKKLSFLRKILQDCELVQLIELLDEYKEAVQILNGKSNEGEAKAGISRRVQALKRLLERQDVELTNCGARRNDLISTLEEKQVMMDSQKEKLIIGQEVIDTVTEERDLMEEEKQGVEERAQESEAMFRAQERELEELLREIESKEKRGRRADKRKSVFENVLDKQKSRKAVETLNKHQEEKQETLNRTKKGVDEIRLHLEKKRASVRHLREAVLFKTKELVSVDQCILDTMEDIKKLKQEIRQNEFDLSDLQREIEETQEELQQTKECGMGNRAFKIPLWRLENPEKPKAKVLNYADILENNSYSLGSLGMRTAPLQFDFPCCIATHNGLIYTADRNNCRVLIFDGLGALAREPIDFGSTAPTAVAVNKRGNIVATDSRIIKVYSSDGALSHNFLPVYSKKDTRPEISALTLDKDGNILAADRPNHRIQKFRIDGYFLGFLGGSMYLQYPSGVAITKDNAVVVSESASHQLKIFHDQGKSFDVVGRCGAGKDQFMNPRGLALDNKGNILVADSLNHRIQVIDPQGNFIGRFGRLGSGPGCIDGPYAVAVNRHGHVVVADSGNHRVTIFT